MSDSDQSGKPNAGGVKLGALTPEPSQRPSITPAEGKWERVATEPEAAAPPPEPAPSPVQPTPASTEPPPPAPAATEPPAARAAPVEPSPAQPAPSAAPPPTATEPVVVRPVPTEPGPSRATGGSDASVSIGRGGAAAAPAAGLAAAGVSQGGYAAVQPTRYAEEPVAAEPRPRAGSVDPLPSPYVTNAPRGGLPNRNLLIGAGVAVALGALLAFLFRPGLDRDEREQPVRTAEQREAPQGDGGAEIAPAREPYRPPDREAVRLAYQRVAQVYSAEGASGLARFGQQCFRTLEQGATYRDLDFCLAFDAYAAAIVQRASGGRAPAGDSYFGQTETRQARFAQAVIGGQGDASARLIDIRQLAIEVARETGPVAPARAAAGPQPGQAASGAPNTPASDSPDAYAQAPAPEPTDEDTPFVVSRQRTAPAPAPRQPNPAPRQPAAAPRQPNPAPQQRVDSGSGPTAEEVARARPTGRGPSFNCRNARSRSEQMICADPSLASLDRRLNAAFEDAIAAGADRGDLRREQDAWLVEREGAAPDPEAVADAYRRRIRELNAVR